MKGVKVTLSNSKNDKNKLIEHLYDVMNTEINKPYEEIDADFIEACVELILELQGKNFTLSNEEIEDRVRKIPFVEVSEFEAAAQRKRKKIKKRKILLIAAIVTLIITLIMSMASGNEYTFFDVFKHEYGSVFDTPVNVHMTEGNEEFFYLGREVSYKNPQDYYEAEGNVILYPTKLPGEIKLNEIIVVEPLNYVILFFDSEITAFEIHFGCEVSQREKDSSVHYTTSNNILCYIERFEEVGEVQIYFEHNGNYYMIGGTDEQILLNVIENLEEYK